VREVSGFACGANGIARPAQEHRDLGDIELTCAVLEHLWNTTAVHGWGSLEDRFQRVLCSLNESAQLVTVGEDRRRMSAWSGRLAKAKVAGSNPVFRSN